MTRPTGINGEQYLEKFLLELRDDPVLAAREILGVELAPHQRIALRGMWTHHWAMNVWGRGSGKSKLDAVFVAISAVLYPDELIVILGPGFRQSQLVFQEVEKFAFTSSLFSDCIKGGSRGIKHGTNEYSIEFKNGSWVRAVPLGADGSKIRGYRAHRLIIDEFVQVPPEIINSVAIPFMATAKDPMAQYLGREQGETNNILVLSSSAYYTFSPAFQRYSTFLEEIYKNHNPDYFLSSFNYLDCPKGFMDEKAIELARSQSSEAEFLTEWMGKWVSDTSGFYPASLIDNCSSLNVFPELEGQKNAKYVLGVDPASVYNTCGFTIMKIGEPNTLVNCESFGPIKYTEICSRILEYMSRYDIVRIGIDAGAGLPILNMFQEGRQTIDKNGAISTVKLLALDDLGSEGRRIFQVVPGTSQAVNEVNYAMKSSMEDNQIKWPKIAGDFEENTILERESAIEHIRQLESEFRMVEATPTRSGWLSFNVPSHKNKDRYSSALFAHYAAKQYQADSGQQKLILPSGFWVSSNRFN